MTCDKRRFPYGIAPHNFPRPQGHRQPQGICPETIEFMGVFGAASATLPVINAAGIPHYLKINACRNA